MRLESVRLKNFRSCYETTVQFAEHITLLVGENDAGKSNVIDALRTAVPPASGRPTLWFDAERDLSYEIPIGEPIEIDRVYAGLTADEDGFYMPALVDPHRKLIHNTAFLTDPDLPRRHRVSHTIGESKVPDPEPENRDRIAHVYLQPLRDAASALDSASGSRLADVFRVIASKDEIAAFEDKANATLGGLADDDTARKVVKGVQSHLTSVTQPVRHRIVDVKHRQQRLGTLARALRLHMAAEGLTPSDLLASGLGYANLLFIATVVLELAKASDLDLMLLLVEEPEAHLHPQLQSVLLSYLEDQAILSAEQHNAPDEPEGRIQVIATSHSPHLASSVSIDNVVVVRSRNRRPSPTVPALPDGSELPPDVPHTETITVSLGLLGLAEADRRKVDRYLDATRASLLFARQVVLVEGIAEAMLLRTLAQCAVYASSKDSDPTLGGLNRRLREQFSAISVVPIGGVDFFPYARVLLPDEGALVDRLVVVTDGDGGSGAMRSAALKEAFSKQVESGCLEVFVGETTLEAELYAAPKNETVLREAFKSQHPRSLEKWDALMSGKDADDKHQRAAAFSDALRSKRLDLGKGDFAQVIAELARSGGADELEVPEYLAAAIKAAVINPDLASPESGEDGGS